MTEIHTRKTEGVISLSQRKFTLVELHLHFQYIILRFHAMPVSTLHIFEKFRQ